MPGQRGSEERRMPLEVLVRMDWVLHKRLTTAVEGQDGPAMTLAGWIRALINEQAPQLADIDVPAYLPISRPKERQKPASSDVLALETIPPAAGKVAGLTRHLGAKLRACGEIEAASILDEVREALQKISLWAVVRIEMRIDTNGCPIDEDAIRAIAEKIIRSGAILKEKLDVDRQLGERDIVLLERYVSGLSVLLDKLADAERGCSK